MPATIINPQSRYQRAPLLDPSPAGYLHLAALVEPPRGRTPIPRRTPRKTALLAELKALAAQLRQHEAVTSVAVYRAALLPPVGPDAQRLTAHPARYDVVVLIETVSPDAIAAVEQDPGYQRMRAAITSAARDHYVMRARCLRRVGDVDKTRPGLFLFNYFAAKDPEVALDVWDHLAGWYVAETGMDNSTLLGPLGPGDYVFVNHARWDSSLAMFAAKTFTKRSFYSYVVANLQANDTAAMPILFRLA